MWCPPSWGCRHQSGSSSWASHPQEPWNKQILHLINNLVQVLCHRIRTLTKDILVLNFTPYIQTSRALKKDLWVENQDPLPTHQLPDSNILIYFFLYSWIVYNKNISPATALAQRMSSVLVPSPFWSIPNSLKITLPTFYPMGELKRANRK